MQYVKLLSLAVMAAMAVMAFASASTASATTLCILSNCSSHYLSGTTFITSLSSGSAILETSGGTILTTCTSGEIDGNTSNTGGEAISITISLTWGNCTQTTDTVVNGSLSIKHIEGTNDGAVTATGIQVTISTGVGSCTYGPKSPFEAFSLGTLDGKGLSTLDVNAVVYKTAGGFACPSEARWTASYIVTSPSGVTVGA